jgi:hypothetical protein
LQGWLSALAKNIFTVTVYRSGKNQQQNSKRLSARQVSGFISLMMICTLQRKKAELVKPQAIKSENLSN